MQSDAREASMNRSRSFLLLQALAGTLFAVMIAAMSHGLGGDAAPSLLTLVLTLAVALPIVALLQRVHARLPRQIVTIGLSQIVFHTLFWLNPGDGATSASGQSHHLTHLVVTLPSASGFSNAPGAQTMDMTFAGGMIWAHVTAAILTLAMWRYGDSLTGAIAQTVTFRLRWLNDRATTVVAVVLEVADLRLTANSGISSILRHRLLSVGLRHRGPPPRFA